MTINTGNPTGQDSNPKATASAIRKALEERGTALSEEARCDLEMQLRVAEGQIKAAQEGRSFSAKLEAEPPSAGTPSRKR